MRDNHKAKIYVLSVLDTQDEVWTRNAISNFENVKYISYNNLKNQKMNDLTGVVYVDEDSKPSIDELYELYEEYKNSDINEGVDIPEVLHFLYFC